MKDYRRIAVKEWAVDNGLALSGKQIEELGEALEIADDMSKPWGYGIGQLQTRENAEIKLLKGRIDLLTRFILSKGYNITLYDDKIIETIEYSQLDIVNKEFR